MKKFFKYLIGLVVFVLVLLILAIIFLPKLINLTAIANDFADKAEGQIGRQISIQNVSFSIFSGVHLKGVVLSNAPGYSSRPMVVVKDIALKYKLWPLIAQKKVVITAAGLDGLDLVLELRAKGSNLDGLGDSKKATTVKPSTLPKTEMKDMKTVDLTIKSPLEINVNRIFFTNSNIDIINHVNAKKLQVKDINLVVNDFSTDLKYKPLKLNASLKLFADGEKTKIEFFGKMPSFNSADLELNIDKIVLDKLMSPFIAPNENNKKDKTTKKSTETTEELPLDFMFLKNMKLDFIFNLKEFQNKNLKVQKVKAKASLNKLAYDFDAEAFLYKGSVKLMASGNLNNPVPDFKTKISIHAVNAAAFLDEALDIKDFVEGIMLTDGEFSGELRRPKKISGFANVSVKDGKYVSGAIFGGGRDFLKGIEGKSFKEFFLELKLKEGKPSLGVVKIEGDFPLISIDFSKSAVEHLESALLQAKEQLKKEITKKTAEVKEQATVAIEEKKAEIVEEIASKQIELEGNLKKEAEAALKNVLDANKIGL